MTKYPSMFPLKRDSDVMFVVSGFGGGYKGTGGDNPGAARYWWGGGGFPGPAGSGLMVPTDDSDNNNTQFGWQQPIMKDGTPYWYYQNTGNAAREQQIITEQIDMLADAGVKAINFFYYVRTPELVFANGIPVSEKIFHWFDLYQSSPSKPKVKFCLTALSLYASFDDTSATFIPVTQGSWKNLPTMAAYWCSLMQDPQYLRDRNGNPILYMYNVTVNWDATRKTVIDTAATNAGLTIKYVMLDHNTTVAANFGSTIASYGPTGNGLATGQNSYQTQINKDRTINQIAAADSFTRHTGMTLFINGRPTQETGGFGWADSATYTEAEAHLSRTFGYARAVKNNMNNNAAVYAYAAAELAEGGPFFPTRQSSLRGPNTPSRGVWLDALYNVSRGIRLKQYTDHYTADSLHADITRPSGTWTLTTSLHNGGGSNIGAYEFKEQRTSSAGGQWKIAPALACTRIRIYGPTGAAFGGFNAQVDAGGQTPVSQTAGSTTFNVLLFDSGPLTKGLHSVTITQTSGTISLDEAAVDIDLT